LQEDTSIVEEYAIAIPGEFSRDARNEAVAPVHKHEAAFHRLGDR